MAVGKSIGREIVWAVDYKCTNRRRRVGAMSLLGPCSKGSSAEVLGPLEGGGDQVRRTLLHLFSTPFTLRA